MRVELPRRFERFGSVRIHNVQEVFQLDSGLDPTDPGTTASLVDCVAPQDINAIEKRMAIVVPCRSERLKVIEGVISGIPHDCLVIVVSNSPRHPVDRYQMEAAMLAQYAAITRRPLVAVHQEDPGAAAGFMAGGYRSIVHRDRIRTGKAEGMLLGIALAMLAGKDYIGFVDADNYVPGAVHEYVKAYAYAFHRAGSPFAMVRINWASKPKVKGGRLFFGRHGRVSENTNRIFNEVLEFYTGFGTDAIQTGNAGEHALTAALALELEYAAGYAVEPFEIISCFEQFSGVHPPPNPRVMERGVDIYQIRSKNPHFHDDKGDEHIRSMMNVSMQVIRDSSICPPPLRTRLEARLRPRSGQRLPRVRQYPAIKHLDLAGFGRAFAAESRSLLVLPDRQRAPFLELPGATRATRATRASRRRLR